MLLDDDVCSKVPVYPWPSSVDDFQLPDGVSSNLPSFSS